MRRYGLLGYPLTHSFSQQYFTEKFEREGIAGLFLFQFFADGYRRVAGRPVGCRSCAG